MPNSVSLSLQDGDDSSPRDPTTRCARLLREMAAEILRVAPEIDGPMPADVSEFVRRHHDLSSRRDR
jgi:hypothetical protein